VKKVPPKKKPEPKVEEKEEPTTAERLEAANN
jgi:hypothetical protein